MEGFYERIEELLKEQHKTQKALVESVGMGFPQAYTTAKTRNTMPKADLAVKIARYLNTTVEYLVTGEQTEGKYKATLEGIADTIKESLEGIKKSL